MNYNESKNEIGNSYNPYPAYTQSDLINPEPMKDSYGPYRGAMNDLTNAPVEENYLSTEFKGYQGIMTALAVLCVPLMICLVITRIEYEVLTASALISLMGILSLTHRKQNVFHRIYMIVITILGIGGIVFAGLELILWKNDLIERLLGGNIATRVLGLMIATGTLFSYAMIFDYQARLKDVCSVYVTAKVVDIKTSYKGSGPKFRYPIYEYTYMGKIHRIINMSKSYLGRNDILGTCPSIGSMRGLYVNPDNFNEMYFEKQEDFGKEDKIMTGVRVAVFIILVIIVCVLFKIPYEG